jgi:dephospho-CoA kinase
VSGHKVKAQIPVIGVTGAIGSGKSSVARLFAAWGAITISGDEVGHHVIATSRPIQKKLSAAFGQEIFTNGALDRVLLARRAFASPSGVLKLNRIVHPELIRQINRAIRDGARHRSVRAVVVDAALLVEWGLGKIDWDYLVGVSAPYDVRIRRLRARGLTLAQIRRFSAAQMPWQTKQTYCDFTVKNDASMPILRRRARLCWDKMLSSE